MTVLAAVNVEAVVIFAIVLAITLGITYWASKRATSAVGFYAAGRQITGVQNGLAISGDYLSAASFLGIAGLIFLFGFDGFLYSIGFLVAFLTVMFLLAERMRNAGKYTIADVLAFRLRERPARTAAALGTLAVVAFYLIAQMVGAGVLIQALVGIDFSLAVILTGAFMLCYVVFGGMVATTWVQIIKAVLLMTGILVMSIFVLAKVGGNPIELFNRAEEQKGGADSTFSLGPGTFLASPIDTVSLGLALVLGTAGLPHILMRFFTVPNAKAARSSVVWAMFIIGFFYLLTTFIGFGARAFLGPEGEEAAGTAGNLAAPNLAQFLGGGEGTFGGDLFLAVIAGVAFATILAVVAGLVLSASAAVSHDIWSNIVRKGKESDHEEVVVARIAAISIGVIAIAIAVIGGAGLNVSFMVGLAFAVAASANFPALLLALTWPRFNTAGAVTGVLFGVVSAIFLVIVSPKVWPGADTDTGSPIGWTLANPGIVSIPLGFIGCCLGTVLSKEHGAEHTYHELYVRSETGLGAERALVEERELVERDRRDNASGRRPRGRRRVHRLHRGGERHGRRSDARVPDRGAARPGDLRTAEGVRRERASSPTSRSYEQADADHEGFWAEQAEQLHWFEKWDQVLDWSDPPNAKWFVGRQAQRRLQLRRPPRRGRQRRPRRLPLARRGGRGARRHLRRPAPRRPEVRQRAQGQRHRQGRRRRDLPADDPRGRGRDARVRAHRRDPQRRLRRLLGRVGQGAHGVLRGEGARDRRRRPPQGQDRGDQGAGRRGHGRREVDREDLRRQARGQRRADDRRPRRLVPRGAARRPPTSARPSRWTPSTRSTSSTRRARRPSRRASCTRRAAT